MPKNLIGAIYLDSRTASPIVSCVPITLEKDPIARIECSNTCPKYCTKISQEGRWRPRSDAITQCRGFGRSNQRRDRLWLLTLWRIMDKCQQSCRSKISTKKTILVVDLVVFSELANQNNSRWKSMWLRSAAKLFPSPKACFIARSLI